MRYLLFAFALFASSLTAQNGTTQRAGRLYDTATVETIHGTIEQVQMISSPSGQGVHLMLQTDTELIPVHLGPNWYLDHQGISLKVGERATITGSRIQDGGNPFIIASDIVVGTSSTQLREPDGTPLWRGKRQQ